jgi:hypothetical protein
MRVPPDYHVHSCFSEDGDETRPFSDITAIREIAG